MTREKGVVSLGTRGLVRAASPCVSLVIVNQHNFEVSLCPVIYTINQAFILLRIHQLTHLLSPTVS